MNVDNLFEDEIVADTEQETVEETEQEQGVKNDVVPPATEQKEQQDSRFVPITALLDERDKRQNAERQLAELQKTAQPVEDDSEEVFYENPTHFVKSQVQNLKAEFVQQQHLMRIELSESILFETKPDAEEKLNVFKEEAAKNPALVYGLNAAKNPALYAYNEGKKILASKQAIEDPEAYKEKLRKEIMAELEGKQPLKVPQTLTDAPNLNSETVAEDDDDFNNLFKRR